MYDLKTEIGCTHLKDAFITENVFLLFCSEQIRFQLLKLIKKKIYPDLQEIEEKNLKPN